MVADREISEQLRQKPEVREIGLDSEGRIGVFRWAWIPTRRSQGQSFRIGGIEISVEDQTGLVLLISDGHNGHNGLGKRGCRSPSRREDRFRREFPVAFSFQCRNNGDG
jgi:hypothetical protein